MERFRPAKADVGQAVIASGVFDSVEVSAREALLAAFDGLRLETGEVLMREGDVGDALYIVRHGRLRTTVVADGETVEVGQIGKSEVVGEMALITDERRSATVTAMRDTELFRLPAEAFSALTGGHPDMLRPFAGVVVERLRSTLSTRPRPSLPATITLLPTPGVAVEGLAAALSDAMAELRSTVVTPADAAGRTDLAAWLLDIENEVDVSLLIADDVPTAWTQQCLRHADRVLLVARDHRPSALTPVEAEPGCAARLDELPVELVMHYEHRPSSSAWLADRSIEEIHNLRDGVAADIARLVRRLTGNATVLALGGGGARGFAHVGVLRALDEARIPIDAVVGTSAGAVVGAGYALVHDVDVIEDTLLTWFDQVRWRRDMTPPSYSLLSGRLITEAFRGFFGDWHLEDLTIDFAAVSTDLTSAGPFIHVAGPLWRAVRASCAVPGIFPPVVVGGQVLVDGGLVANLPVEIAKHRHAGARVIAVEVGDPTGIDPGALDDSGIASGWRMQRTGGAGPTLSRVLMRLTELGRNDGSAEADVLLRPDVSGFSLTDAKPARTIMARGYEATVQALDRGELTPTSA